MCSGTSLLKSCSSVEWGTFRSCLATLQGSTFCSRAIFRPNTMHTILISFNVQWEMGFRVFKHLFHESHFKINTQPLSTSHVCVCVCVCVLFLPVLWLKLSINLVPNLSKFKWLLLCVSLLVQLMLLVVGGGDALLIYKLHFRDSKSQKPTFHQLRRLENLESGVCVCEKEPFV